jgi:hypothetical protein
MAIIDSTAAKASHPPDYADVMKALKDIYFDRITGHGAWDTVHNHPYIDKSGPCATCEARKVLEAAGEL